MSDQEKAGVKITRPGGSGSTVLVEGAERIRVVDGHLHVTGSDGDSSPMAILAPGQWHYAKVIK
jgi:hypothetical protein